MSAVDHLQARLDATQAHLALVNAELGKLVAASEPVPADKLHDLVRLSGFNPEAAALACRAQVATELARSWPKYTRDMVSRGKVNDWLLEQAQHAQVQIERLPGGWAA